MGRLFGTDGIRGIVGEDLTEDLARDLGRSAVAVLAGHGVARPTFLIGRDTRASGEPLESALAEGICSAGGDVLLAGVQTTPAVAFLVPEVRASWGAMISASHNPPEYNGIKLFEGRGYKLPDDVEDEIEARMPEQKRPAARQGRVRRVPDARQRYLDHLLWASRAPLTGWKVVVDSANGSASEVAPEALRRMGAEVVTLHDHPDGKNINVGSGAMLPEVMAAAVVETGADAGVAHDGDADRSLFADADGNVIDGDQVLAACALAFRDEGRLAGDAVVTTVMANLGFRRAMEEAGIEVLTTRVGDRYVLEEMLRSGAVLGGEQSGHIIFSQYATTGDGILTAITFLSLAAKREATVAELASCMRRYPQVLENVEVRDRESLDSATAVWEAVKESERALGDSGRVLVRASGTEPLVRVMVEAETEELATSHARALAERVRSALG